MGGHVEEEEVLLFRAADAFVDEIFGQAFAHIPQLILELQWIPTFT